MLYCEDIVNVEFSAYRVDYDAFMEECKSHGYDETELFCRMMDWWLAGGNERWE